MARRDGARSRPQYYTPLFGVGQGPYGARCAPILRTTLPFASGPEERADVDRYHWTDDDLGAFHGAISGLPSMKKVDGGNHVRKTGVVDIIIPVKI